MGAGRGRVLVTGATGFLGRALAAALAEAGFGVVRGARLVPPEPPRHEVWRAHGDITTVRCWHDVLADIGAVLHLAGLAHLDDRAAARTDALHRVNVKAPRALPRPPRPRACAASSWSAPR